MKKLFIAISSVMLIFLFVAPYTASAGSFLALDGSPGVIDHADLWGQYDHFTRFIYTLGDLICHQEQDRTFLLNGSEMPVCVRDVGINIGFVIGASLVLVLEGNTVLDRYSIRFSAIGLGLMLVDWIIQHIFVLNIPLTRMITGITAGIAIMLAIFHWVDGKFYRGAGKIVGQKP